MEKSIQEIQDIDEAKRIKGERAVYSARVDRCVAILRAFSEVIRLGRSQVSQPKDPGELIVELEIIIARIKQAL